jgi:hypothetical protein
MPDWKKVLYYNHHVTGQFPRLDGKPVDMTTPEYKRIAIQHVNDVLKTEQAAYEKRVKRREDKTRFRQEEKERLAKLHVVEMKKKYGWDWYRDVEDGPEDCKEAYDLREEEDHRQEIAYYDQEKETQRMMQEMQNKLEKDEHQETFFRTLMEIETRGMSDAKKSNYIQERHEQFLLEKMEEELRSDCEFEEEGIQWCRAFENAQKHRHQKQMRIAAYEAKKASGR